MTVFTFSKLGKVEKIKRLNSQENHNDSNNYINKIEKCRNYQQRETLKDPKADILAGLYKSVVFKKEIMTDFVNYEYWEKAGAHPTYFSICVSTKDGQLDSIRDEYGYTVPLSSFRIDSENELEIVSYDRCRPF